MFCRQRGISEIQASVAQGIDFLTDLYENNHSYSGINTARSTLSAVLILDTNVAFGCHPLVVRFMKFFYNLRPPRPRYLRTWDVDVLLRLLRRLSPVKELTFKDLVLKLVTLMSLVTAQRAQTLHLLDVNMLKKDKFGYTFVFDKVIKTSRPGQSLPVLVFKAYPRDRRLCIVTVLKEFIKRRALKVKSSVNKFLVSYVAPHQGVSTSTISRWIKTMMARAGIDTDRFKPHSVRGASTSKAKKADYPIDEILKAAGWSNASTFARFYDRPVAGSSFADTVLKL